MTKRCRFGVLVRPTVCYCHHETAELDRCLLLHKDGDCSFFMPRGKPRQPRSIRPVHAPCNPLTETSPENHCDVQESSCPLQQSALSF